MGIPLLVAAIMCPQVDCALRVNGMDAARICFVSFQLVWRVLVCRHRSWNDAVSSARNPAYRAHCHHSSNTRRGWLAAKKTNDIRRGATAYTNVLKVLAHSWAGHKSMAVTMRYMHLTQTALRETIRLLEGHGQTVVSGVQG